MTRDIEEYCAALGKIQYLELPRLLWLTDSILAASLVEREDGYAGLRRYLEAAIPLDPDTSPYRPFGPWTRVMQEEPELWVARQHRPYTTRGAYKVLRALRGKTAFLEGR